MRFKTLWIGLLFCSTAYAQRASLGPVVPSTNYQRALKQGTRASTGAPGARYWQNTAHYKITARVDTDAKRLDGMATISYKNNSPDPLVNLHLDILQNFHRPDAQRREAAPITKGFELKKVVVGGQEIAGNTTAGARYEVHGTRMIILPPRPVPAGGTVELTIDYGFDIPQNGISGRMGWSEDNFFFLAYWYPQMVVYDDVVGWHPDAFTGPGEFYVDFSNYDYTIDAPAHWVLNGTGDLLNAQQALAPEIYQRLRRAEASDQVVAVVTHDDFGKTTVAGANGRVEWHFVAENVRDVAFSMTFKSLWDAQRTPVGDRDGDGKTDYTRVDALYRETAPLWRSAARYSAHAIAHHSRFIGIPYPWLHMSAVEGAGIISGGMEYPMMTLIGSYNNRPATSLYAVITHEEAHMWFPMMVSNDERRYGWMDEGTTDFNENTSETDFYKEKGPRFYVDEMEDYLTLARAGGEGEVMRWSDFHYSSAAFGTASYDKPATLLVALRGVLGDTLFMKAYREYAQRWKYKHPYPWDMWNTFEHVSGRDLDWFWQQWYHTTWTLDQAVGSVTTAGASTAIVIEDRGQAVMPTTVTVTRENGQKTTSEIPVETWLKGATTTTVTVPAQPRIVRVEIDARHDFPDVNRTNNVWSAR
jgi:hypothetical protein